MKALQPAPLLNFIVSRRRTEATVRLFRLLVRSDGPPRRRSPEGVCPAGTSGLLPVLAGPCGEPPGLHASAATPFSLRGPVRLAVQVILVAGGSDTRTQRGAEQDQVAGPAVVEEIGPVPQANDLHLVV